MLTIVLLAIVIALLFDFLNGMNDAANSIATIVATRVFSPTMAVCWAAFWNFAAIFIFGVSVAHTMGEGIVDPSKINEYLILAALIGSVIWVWLCTHFGMPISVSHALIGGLSVRYGSRSGVTLWLLPGYSKLPSLLCCPL